MCGIAGVFSPERKDDPARIAAAMAGALIHRGPDSDGLWSDAEAGVALAHRRLSIIDLSPQGAQPMLSASGRYVLTYNGEIFNYRDLKAELDAAGQAPAWRGHSDSEVLLAAIEAWGLERALARAEGQMAFGLWDRQTRTLHLARDRFGEKPLYYGWAGRDLVFGSELKALRMHPRFDASLDDAALASFFRYGYAPTPSSIYRTVRKLEPGCFVSIGQDELSSQQTTPRPYWRLLDEVTAARNTPFAGSEDDAVEALDPLARRVVGSRMVSDAPLGALLSGGIDSSLVVALMQAQSNQPIKTFTIGSGDKTLNEAEHAREVARVLGTDHTELYVSGQDALEVVPKLPEMYDEPFADSSQIPTHLVSALARRSVTVALSGDGGDEIFGGYNRYLFGPLWSKLGRTPRSVRALAAGAVHAISPEVWTGALRAAGPLSPGVLRSGRGGDKLHKFADKLNAESEQAFLLQLISMWDAPQILKSGTPALDLPRDRAPATDVGGFAETAMYLDTTTYLPDDILVKVDRASMAVSLEARGPFLSTELLRFAWSLPLSMKVRGRRGKHILRRVLARYVPPALFERPKQGFAVPVDHWLRHELRDWSETLLSADRLGQSGIFNIAEVRKLWAEHLSGRRNWDMGLWSVLMFQAWSEAQSPQHATEVARAPVSAAAAPAA